MVRSWISIGTLSPMNNSMPVGMSSRFNVYAGIDNPDWVRDLALKNW